MAEKVGIDLELGNKVSEPARRAEESLRRVEAQTIKAQQALQGKFAGSWEKIGLAAHQSAYKQQSGFANAFAKIGASAEKSAKKQQSAFASSWAKIGLAADRAGKRQEEQAKKQAERNSFLTGISEATGFGKLASAAFLGSLLADSLIEGAKKAVELITEGVKFAFEAGVKAENTSLGFRVSLGKEEGERAERDASRLAKVFGLGENFAAQLILQSRRSGLSQASSRENLAIAADIATGKGHAADPAAIAAISEILTKVSLRGGVTRKMLTGELGINAEAFYKVMGAKLHLSAAGKKGGTSAVEQYLEKDSGHTQMILNALGAIAAKGGAIGSAGAEGGTKMGAMLSRLRDLPEQYFGAISKSPAWSQLEKKFGSILEQLDPESPNGQRIITSLIGAFGHLGDLVSEAFTPANITSFVSGIEHAVEAAGKLVGIMEDIARLVGAKDTDAAELQKRIATMEQFGLNGPELEKMKRQLEAMRPNMTPSEQADYNAAHPKEAKPIHAPVATPGAVHVNNVFHIKSTDPKGAATEVASKIEDSVAPAVAGARVATNTAEGSRDHRAPSRKKR